jgi:precorrin-2/cobalt-factor-2 C20-methyltransferase
LKKGKIYGVSLGPGDPELITVKGLNIIKRVDRIYYPGSLELHGKTTSYSLGILNYFNLDKTKFSGMFLKMSDYREAAERTYFETFLKIKKDYEDGLHIAFVSEGDISFYSTFAYLLKHIHAHGLEVEIVAGVPSFLTGVAAHKMPLAVLNERIAILPRMKDIPQLINFLKEFDTIVLIKIRSVVRELTQFATREEVQMVYCERLGTEEQYISTDLKDLENRVIPYFSLMIIKKKS